MQRSKIQTELKEAQRAGKLSGVSGRLGDLGTIAEKFDTAVSTACNYLDFIVVDKIEQAEACIKYLREHRIGKASFIALDRVDSQVERIR